MYDQSGWRAQDASDSDADAKRSEAASASRSLAHWRPGTGNPRVDLAIRAWLHAKLQRSGSVKTRTAYASILGDFRAALEMEGLDLDGADPRRCREDVVLMAAATDVDYTMMPTDSASIEDLMAARATAMALVAQAYAARPAQTRYGPRPVAPTTANLRLAALSSFYTYASRQDLIRGPNPIARVERRRVEAYAAARPLAYDDLRERLADIDVAGKAGLRDYALLLVALHTGRRVAELAGMRCEHLRIHKHRVEISWPRCKGGKSMRDELPRGGARGEAADALVAWMTRLYEEGGQSNGDPAVRAVVPSVAPQPGYPREQPLWVSLARNGTAGHALTAQAIAQLCEKRLGTSKVHALRHAQPISAPVLTPTGWKTIGDLRKGDAIIGSNGRPTEVLGVYSQGEQEVYRVHFTDGAVVCCTADHLWTARRGLAYYNWRYTRPSRAFTTLSTREIMESAQRWSVPVVEPVQFSQSTRLPMDPYTLGALLGDGHFGHNLILATAKDETEVIARIAVALPSGHTVSGIPGRYLLSGGSNRHYSNRLIASARALELLGMKSRDKSIPAVYMTASVESRQELLRGLMDTDGAASKTGAASFTTISDKLAVDVVNLVRSLGGIATIRSRLPYKTAKHRAWRLCIRTPFTPFHMTSKVERYEASKHVQLVRAIDRIEPNGVAVCVCIQVDNENGLYVTQDYVLTHNTFARAMEDAGAKVSEIQAALGHADLGTTGRYLARLHQGENRHLTRLSGLYGLGGLDQRMNGGTTTAAEADPVPGIDTTLPREAPDGSSSS